MMIDCSEALSASVAANSFDTRRYLLTCGRYSSVAKAKGKAYRAGFADDSGLEVLHLLQVRYDDMYRFLI